MKRIHLLTVAACLVPLISANAQEPQQPIQQTRGLKSQIHKVEDAVADAHAQQNMYQTTYAGHKYGAGQYEGAAYGGAQYGGGAYCPPSYYGGAYCQNYGSDLSCYPRHNYTYGYQRPRHLVYPQQNSVGGAVVYPYYTHKGPSDFFRK